MIAVYLFLVFAAGLGLAAGYRHVLGRRYRSVVEVQPRYRSLFRHLGLIEAGDFLALPAVIVNGHPDRNVGRVTLGEKQETFTAFLKREHSVPWTARWASLLAGYGFVSRSLREARTLQALHREGLGCAEWLAAGEHAGRAFVLVREVAGGIELRSYLRDEADGSRRTAALRSLGVALARLHHLGFQHPDLYAKHIFINPANRSIHVLDWQRSRRRRWLSWRRRARDLAALDATVSENLAVPRERLRCLRSYVVEATARRPALGGAGEALRPLLERIAALTRRMLQRRHVREKRQLPIEPESQTWICLEDGEALCITPALRDAWPGRTAEWLSLDRQPIAENRTTARRWLRLPTGASVLLMCRRAGRRARSLWGWLGRKPATSPEKRLACLLFRLQRHGVQAPRVLAMGERDGVGGSVESFVLTEPMQDTVRLDTWLARAKVARNGVSIRSHWNILRHLGDALHRMHEAGCYLGQSDAAEALAVHVPPRGESSVVLSSGEGIRLCRRPQPNMARRDLATVQRCLSTAGCGKTDLRRFIRSYEGSPRSSAGQRVAAPARPKPARQSVSVEKLAQAVTRPQGDRVMSGVEPADPQFQTTDPESFWQRLIHGSRRSHQRQDWEAYVGSGWDSRIMDVMVTDRFNAKQGRSCGRWILQAAKEPGRTLAVYLKRHYELPWWCGLMATLWPKRNWSPAMQEWEHLEWARRQGVPVPKVVAAGETIGPWGRLQSFLAVEELTDMLPLHEAIPLASRRLDAVSFRRWKRALIAEMARLSRMLHDRRCFHKDLYLCHFYIARADTAALTDWRGRLFLIDLHRLAHHRWSWRLWQLKDLAQLLYSSEIVGVDARDQLAFWAAYRGTGPRRGTDRWLRRWVLVKWQRYRRHNARHKTRAA